MSAITETKKIPDMRVGVSNAAGQVIISDGDIVSEENQNRLMYWRDKMTEGAFDIGDITREIIDANLTTGYRVANDRVYHAVGRFCGRASRTVRYYAECAAFYTKDVRERYHMLPFSHFVAAKTFGNKWEEVLEYAASNPSSTIEELNRIFATGRLVAKKLDSLELRELSQDLPDTEVVIQELEGYDSQNAGNFASYNSIEVMSASGDLIFASTRFLTAADSWRRAVDETDDRIPDAVKDKVRTALNSVMKALPDMVLMLDVI